MTKLNRILRTQRTNTHPRWALRTKPSANTAKIRGKTSRTQIRRRRLYRRSRVSKDSKRLSETNSRWCTVEQRISRTNILLLMELLCRAQGIKEIHEANRKDQERIAQPRGTGTRSIRRAREKCTVKKRNMRTTTTMSNLTR